MDVVLDIQLSAFLHFSFARLLVYNPANDSIGSVSAPLRDLTQLSLFQRLLPFSCTVVFGSETRHRFLLSIWLQGQDASCLVEGMKRNRMGAVFNTVIRHCLVGPMC